GAAYVVIGLLDLFIRKTKRFQQVPFEIKILFGAESQSLQALFAQRIYVEYKSYFESRSDGCIELFDLLGNKAFFTQALVIDKWSARKGSGAHCIFNDRLHFLFGIVKIP